MSISIKKSYFNLLIFLFFFIVYHIDNTYSQNCTQTLRNAQRAYDEGRIAEIPNILNICLKKGFSRDEKIKAYRLLTLSYLYQYEGISAEKTMLEFLKVVPDYKLTPEDPAPFAKLYKQFRTWPIFLIGFKFGPNFAQPQAIKGFTAFENNFSKYSSALGFSFAINGEIFINNKMSLNTGLNFLINRHKYSISGLDSSFNKSYGTENELIIAIPLALSYNIYSRGDFTFFAKAGAATNFLLGANIKITPVNNVKDVNNQPQTVTPPQGIINLNSQRNKLNFSVILGGGVKYKTGRNLIIFDVSYWAGINDVSKDPWDSYHNGANVTKYGYVSDSFRMNNMMFTLGFLVPIYKPKLLKKN